MQALIEIGWIITTVVGFIVLFFNPLLGIGILLLPIILFLFEIHAKLVTLEIRITQTQTDMSSDPRGRITGPGDTVEPRRTIFHDIYDRLASGSRKE